MLRCQSTATFTHTRTYKHAQTHMSTHRHARMHAHTYTHSQPHLCCGAPVYHPPRAATLWQALKHSKRAHIHTHNLTCVVVPRYASLHALLPSGKLSSPAASSDASGLLPATPPFLSYGSACAKKTLSWNQEATAVLLAGARKPGHASCFMPTALHNALSLKSCEPCNYEPCTLKGAGTLMHSCLWSAWEAWGIVL